MTKIVLGTANFGNEYGVANNGKLLSSEDSGGLVSFAQFNGINHFDTAFAYANSEAILAKSLIRDLNPEVDSKLDDKTCLSAKLIVDSVRAHLENLGIQQFSTIYLHNENLLFSEGYSEIKKGLAEILELGLTKQIGVSVYSEGALTASKKILPELTVFQVPENIMDRRLIFSNNVQRLADSGNKFMVRSIFLQGLLLMDVNNLPSKFNPVQETLKKLALFSNENSMTILELCLAYANSIPWAEGIIIGVASKNQLIEVLSTNRDLPNTWEKQIPILPIEILDPRKWTK